MPEARENEGLLRRLERRRRIDEAGVRAYERKAKKARVRRLPEMPLPLRDLDFVLAEHLLGWKVVGKGDGRQWHHPKGGPATVPNYTTDHGASAEVKAALGYLGVEFTITHQAFLGIIPGTPRRPASTPQGQPGENAVWVSMTERYFDAMKRDHGDGWVQVPGSAATEPEAVARFAYYMLQLLNANGLIGWSS